MDPILKILEQDATESPADIAAKLNLSEDEVKSRIKEYEKEGVIIKYKAVINDELVTEPKEIRALIEVKVKPQKGKGFDGIAEKIYKFPEVVTCMLLSGSYDLLLEVRGDDIQTVAGFVSRKLSQLENVQSTVTHFILKKYKEGGDILLSGDKENRLLITP